MFSSFVSCFESTKRYDRYKQSTCDLKGCPFGQLFCSSMCQIILCENYCFVVKKCETYNSDDIHVFLPKIGWYFGWKHTIWIVNSFESYTTTTHSSYLCIARVEKNWHNLWKKRIQWLNVKMCPKLMSNFFILIIIFVDIIISASRLTSTKIKGTFDQNFYPFFSIEKCFYYLSIELFICLLFWWRNSLLI